MAWITDNALADAVAARLQTTRANQESVSPHWTTIIGQANTEAYQTIRTVLLDRGYSVANIDAWDRRVEWNTKLGVCIALENGAAGRDYPMEAIDRICKCREDLLTVAVVVDDVVVDPEGGSSRVGTGDMDTSGDTFVFDDMVL